MKKNLLNQDGFSLIEVIVAIAILAIGLMSLITMQVTGIKGNSKASHITIASDWGSDRLEQIFALDYDDPDLRDDDDPTNTGPFPVNDVEASLDDMTTPDGMDTSDDGFYTIYWNVVNDLVMPDTKSVRVIIERSDEGQTRTVTMNYLKARYF